MTVLPFLSSVHAKPNLRPAQLWAQVRFGLAAWGAKIHLPQVAWRIEVHDLRWNLRRWPKTYQRIVVVTQADVEHQLVVDSPVVLYERTPLVLAYGVWRLAV